MQVHVNLSEILLPLNSLQLSKCLISILIVTLQIPLPCAILKEMLQANWTSN